MAPKWWYEPQTTTCILLFERFNGQDKESEIKAREDVFHDMFGHLPGGANKSKKIHGYWIRAGRKKLLPGGDRASAISDDNPSPVEATRR
jgi:hypothetical protein